MSGKKHIHTCALVRTGDSGQVDSRPHRFSRSRLGVLLAVVLGCAAAAFVAPSGIAQPAETDPGLTLTPPPGYDSQLLGASGPYAQTIVVKKRDVGDVACWIGFQAISATTGPASQEDINQRAATPAWAERIRASFAGRKHVVSLDPFEHAGVRGTAVVYDEQKAAGDAPPAPRTDVRTLMVILETPKGRTSTICVTKTSAFDGRRAEFEAIVRATNLPR
jgi:hypothetical protein